MQRITTVASSPVATGRAAAQARAPAAPKLMAFRRVATSLGAAAVVLSSAAAPVLASDLVLGAEVFNNNCAACHMGGRNSVIADRTLDKSALEQYLAGGFNIEAITTQVTNGKGAMPAWGDRLDEDEIAAVAAFVFDQASGNKW